METVRECSTSVQRLFHEILWICVTQYQASELTRQFVALLSQREDKRVFVYSSVGSKRCRVVIQDTEGREWCFIFMVHVEHMRGVGPSTGLCIYERSLPGPFTTENCIHSLPLLAQGCKFLWCTREGEQFSPELKELAQNSVILRL